jgi:hypothetical protein
MIVTLLTTLCYCRHRSSTSIYNYSVSRSMEQISRTNRKPQSGPAGLRNGAVTAQRPKQVPMLIAYFTYRYLDRLTHRLLYARP